MRLISKGAVRSVEALNALGSFINKAFLLINSFVPVILTPEEMAAYSKQRYEKEPSPFGDREWVERGLNLSERDVIEKHAAKSGSILVLGCGGGREAIALARMGFDVTGIDSSEKLILTAKEHATRVGADIHLIHGDFLEMIVTQGRFDCCLLTSFMYSAIPSRAIRVSLLSNIKEILMGRGIAIIHFMTARQDRSERLFKLRKTVAQIFRGNLSYQMGDSFHPPGHFFRKFLDEREVVDEVCEGGLSVKEILKDQLYNDGIYAILEKTGNP